MASVSLLFILVFLLSVTALSIALTFNYTTEPTSTMFSTSYLSGKTSNEACFCGCSLPINGTGVEEEIAAILEKLFLDATTTSQYRRKRTSAEDARPSAKGIGYSGILCLVVVFMFVVLSDVTNVFIYFDKHKKTAKDEFLEHLKKSEF